MLALTVKLKQGDYLTDGKILIQIIRIEDNGDLLTEDASTGDLAYIRKGKMGDHWRVVEHGA